MTVKQLFLKIFGKKKNTHSQNRVKIYVSEKTIDDKTEGYNRLRDNVLYINNNGATKVIQIESSMAHEGKTTISCNLSVSLGLADKKVCLVDLDFRKPKVNRAFGLSNDNGIAEYVLGNLGRQDIIKHTKYKNVDIITRGNKIYNSTVVLLSDKFKDLIKSLREEYDYVILDCAPVMLVSDHIHISQVSDGVLFVVAYGTTTKGQVIDAVQTLKRNDTRILGTVFSMYDKNKDKGNRHYYGNYYYRDKSYQYTLEDESEETSSKGTDTEK